MIASLCRANLFVLACLVTAATSLAVPQPPAEENLAVWLRADDGATTPDGGEARPGEPVQRWANVSSRAGVDGAVATGAPFPMLVQLPGGDARAVRFTGEAALQLSDSAALNPGSDGLTVLAVVHLRGQGTLLGKGSPEYGQGTGFALARNGDRLAFRAATDHTSKGRGRVVQHYSGDFTRPGLVTLRITSGSIVGAWNGSRQKWIGGDEEISGSFFSGAIANHAPLRLGPTADGAGVDVAELLIYDRDLAVAERDAAQRYLAEKYGLTLEPEVDFDRMRRLPGVVSAGFIAPGAPGPFAHASTLAEVAPGEVVAAWFGGSWENGVDTAVWLARRSGEAWSEPMIVADGEGIEAERAPSWNPVLFKVPDGPLLLFYKVGWWRKPWQGVVTWSRDGGVTWSKPMKLPDGHLGPSKNKPVLLTNGDLLLPHTHMEWVEGVSEGLPVERWRWHKSADSVNDGYESILRQPSGIVHGDGRVQMLFRTNDPSRRVIELWSSDHGRTWSERALTNVPHNDSGIDAVKLADGRLLLVHNPQEQTTRRRERYPLSISLNDGGKDDWRRVLDLEIDPGEYSYPAVIQSSDGLVHVTYTWRTERIVHVVLDPAALGTTADARNAR